MPQVIPKVFSQPLIRQNENVCGNLILQQHPSLLTTPFVFFCFESSVGVRHNTVFGAVDCDEVPRGKLVAMVMVVRVQKKQGKPQGEGMVDAENGRTYGTPLFMLRAVAFLVWCLIVLHWKCMLVPLLLSQHLRF